MRKQLHLIPIHGRVLPVHIVPLEKGKAYAIGHVSHRKDGDYRKVAKDNWVRIRKRSEQRQPDEAKAKQDAFVKVENSDGVTHLTNLPEWAIGGVYQLGGYTFVATRQYQTMKDGEALLSGDWKFTELTTGLNLGGPVPAYTPEQAEKAAKKKIYEYASKKGTTVREELDRVIPKAQEKAPDNPKIFTGPYIKGPSDEEWKQFAKSVKEKYGGDEPMNWVDVRNSVKMYYENEVAEPGEYSPYGDEMWFAKNRDNLPDEMYDFIRLRTGKQDLAKNIWEMAKIQPTWTQNIFAMYDTNETEILDVITDYLSDRMTTKHWDKDEWRGLLDDIDLGEMKPRSGLESSFLDDLQEVFTDRLTTYEEEAEEEYEEGGYGSDPYDSLPDSISFNTDGTWTKDELYELGNWVTGTVRVPREGVKGRDKRRRENPDSNSGLGDDTAKAIMENMERHPEVPELYRGTSNASWMEAQPGDVLEVGIASFTHNLDVAKMNFATGGGGAVLVIDREDYDGGGFLGVDVKSMIDDVKGFSGDPEEERLIASARVDAHEIEDEFVLRAPRLEVKGVEPQNYGPPHVHVRLVDADLLEKAIWNASEDYDRIARMERTFDYHLADEPEDWT